MIAIVDVPRIQKRSAVGSPAWWAAFRSDGTPVICVRGSCGHTSAPNPIHMLGNDPPLCVVHDWVCGQHFYVRLTGYDYGWPVP